MYRVKLEDFEGPLDLLLFFIRRDELDIYDIPISRITDEFLSYVRLMEEIDLDGVGDFIYMASILIGIKAQMLLPQPETADGEEEIDPRRELVERLLEYMRYKEAAGELEVLQEQRGDVFTRNAAEVEELSHREGPPRLTNATVFRLISSLRRLLREEEEQVQATHTVDRVHYSVEEARDEILSRLQRNNKFGFVDSLRGAPRGRIIANFLAVLELVRVGSIRIELPDERNDFIICEPEPEVTGSAVQTSESQG